MRRSIVFLIFFAVGCGTNTGVQPLGSDTFKIFKQGSTGFVGSDKIRSDVELQASQYCGQQGKSMKVINVITGQPPYILGNFPKAEVQFKCVDPKELQLVGGTTDGGGSQLAALGEVTISSNVANADVSVDGKFIGNAPITALKLTPGTHVFEVSAKGYVTWKRDVTVVQGSATRVVAELESVR
ncbi:MAG TPA: PEGA domain-containing protein [Thermoanaerobaculia bacterium]|jgi:hypothetical protein|nr:PEGA domain-containing protein [Thermoanaerobaculia bacterium]